MIYWSSASFLIVLNAVALLSNLFLLPGNWMMTGLLCLFLLASDFGHGPTWTIVIICVAFSGLGEVLELFQ